MSETAYNRTVDSVNSNVVTIAQAAQSGHVLTKKNYPNSQKTYDNVKFFNFFEEEIWNLHDLYQLSQRMLTKPRCCFLRAKIKDYDLRRNVVRRYLGPEATLVVHPQNWFALDVDGFRVATGDLKVDAQTVLLALPTIFTNVECFVVASASYGIKPGIRMRMFYWNEVPIEGSDLKRVMHDNNAKVDLALFNPIQPIYTAAPIFIQCADPCKRGRIAWIHGDSSCTSIDVKKDYYQGEALYTKKQAENIIRVKNREIARLESGERHNKLFDIARLCGKLIWQGLLEEDYVIDELLAGCDSWSGGRDFKKDTRTITDGINYGKKAMEK